jgi:hypothetical protein
MLRFTETCACMVLEAKGIIPMAISFNVLIFSKFLISNILLIARN